MFREETILTGQVNDPRQERPPSYCVLVFWSPSKPECLFYYDSICLASSGPKCLYLFRKYTALTIQFV